jgi:hypothetical protein
MSRSIMMVSDDGKVYHVQSKDIGKVAKRVPKAKLSADVQAHVEKVASKVTGGKGVAHIFASKADIFVSKKSDIFVAGKNDTLGAAKSDIFISPKASQGAKSDIFVAAKKPGAPKSDIFVAGKKPSPPKSDIFVAGKK